MERKEMFFILVAVFLLIVILALLVRMLSMKREFRRIRKELISNKDQDYNKQISVNLIDNDFNKLISEFNKNLDYQKDLKKKAEQSELTMKQSIADIAHDLRTPLTVIRGNLQMMNQEEELSANGKKYLEISMTQADSLKGMVDDFFELSVLESEEKIAELEVVNANETLIQFIIENEAVIRNNKLEPEIKLPDSKIQIMANQKMFIRVLSNLLNNVIKYARESFVTELCADNECARIIFANKIDLTKPIDVDRLFERAYRASKERKSGSAGLGLHIVKLLCDRQMGKAYAKLDGDMLSIIVEFKLYKEK